MNRNSNQPLETWNEQPLATLMEHIVETHHAFCRREAVRLNALFKVVIDKRGKDHPELKRMQTLFSKMSNDLSMHLAKEEQTLFPYIARVEEAVARKAPISWPAFGTVENPIRMMVMEHDQTGEEIKQIRKLSDGYTPPADVCPSFTALYDGLKAFERDIQEHTYLEDRLLFPRAIAMEEDACANRKSN